MAKTISTLANYAMKAALVLALGAPAIGSVMSSVGSSGENRNLAAWPGIPHSWKEFLAVPGQLDAWVNDHFGMRNELVIMNNRLRFKLYDEFPTIQTARGRNGRIFLASHATTAQPYSAFTAVCGGNSEASPGTAQYFNQMFSDFRARGLQPHVLIVPSAPAVQSADVPEWLVQRCSSADTPVRRFLRDPQLAPDVRAAIYYPLEEIRKIAGDGESVFPKTWFHWNGAGLSEVATLSLQHFWKPGPGTPVKSHEEWLISDISHLFPGIAMSSLITLPNMAEAGIDACHGPDCFSEFAEFKELMKDTSHLHNPAAPPRRLLLISDSYGRLISDWYARYYRDVDHIATNNIPQLKPEQLQRVKDVVFRDAENTDVLILYHDGGAIYNALRFGIEPLHQGSNKLAATAP